MNCVSQPRRRRTLIFQCGRYIPRKLLQNRATRNTYWQRSNHHSTCLTKLLTNSITFATNASRWKISLDPDCKRMSKNVAARICTRTHTATADDEPTQTWRSKLTKAGLETYNLWACGWHTLLQQLLRKNAQNYCTGNAIGKQLVEPVSHLVGVTHGVSGTAVFAAAQE